MMVKELEKAEAGMTEKTADSFVRILSYVVSDEKKDTYTVRFDNGEILDFSAEEFFENSLYETEIPLSICFENLLYKIYSKRAFYEGVRFVLFSRKTVSQVVDHLKSCGFDEDCIDFSVKSLSEEGYLDDFAYTEKFIRKAVDARIVSSMMLVCELKQKGIAEAITKSCLDEMGIDDYTLARKAVAKKNAVGVTDIMKIRRFLSGKGFSGDAIRKALDAEDFE